MRILTWNLGEAEAPVLATIAAVLLEADADFVFLNEAMLDDVFTNGRYGGHQPQELASRCGYPWVVWQVTGGLDKGGAKCVALLSRHPLSKAQPQPAIKDAGGGNYLALEVQADVRGQVWSLYTLRFSAHVEANFERHCALLGDRVLALPGGTPVIAAGDFNGGAHLEGMFLRGPRAGDPAVLRQMTPAIQLLMDRTGLHSATARLPLQEDRVDHPDPERRLPPYFWATDLILFRAPRECIRLQHGRANIGAEAHEWVCADLGVSGTIATLAGVTSLLLPVPAPPPAPRRVLKPPRSVRPPRPPKKPRAAKQR